MTLTKRRWAVNAAFAAVALTAVACRPVDRAPKELVVAIESMPQNLDPRYASDAASARITHLVHRGLARVDAKQRYVPDLAQDWHFESERVLRFRLRRDLYFHDGRPLGAEDVAATYASIRDPNAASPKRELLEAIDRIEVVDDLTLRFHLKEPFAPILTTAAIGVLPAAEARAPRSKDPPTGSGPYRVAAIEAGREVSLAAVGDGAAIATLHFRVVPDDTVRALELRHGSIQLVQNDLEAETIRWLSERPGLCTRQSPGTTFYYLGLNLDDERLRQVEVRRAIAQAIDRDAILEHLLGGAARLATGVLSAGHWAYEGDVANWDFDPAAARRRLDAAGFPDPPGPEPRFVLQYKTTTVEARRRLAETLQAYLAAVGIALEIRSYEWGTLFRDIRSGNFEIYSLAWVGVTDPDIYHLLFHSEMTPPRGNNRGRYSNPAIDRQLEAGRRELDPAQRVAWYSNVQKTLAEELPIIPLWWADTVVVHDARLCGYEIFPDGRFDGLARAWWGLESEAKSGPCGCEGAPP